jgi:UDP-N-acetyl-D-mannosaminuronate dehydrogenase
VLVLGMTFKENCPDIRNSLPFNYQAVVLAVAHKDFERLALCPTSTQVVYGIKSVLAESDGSL